MRGALLALAALFRVHATACPASCRCFNYTWPEYSCENIKLALPNDKLYVTCLKPYVLESFPPLATRNAFHVKLERCSPPSDSWGAALQILGATQTRKLELKAPEQPLPFWKTKHVEGLNGLEQLHLSEGGRVPSDLLSKLQGLRKLQLWTVLLPPTLTLPGSLMELNLVNCNLTELSEERAFLTAPGLLHLSVDGYDEVMRVAPGALAGLTQLQSIRLNECLLGMLPPRWLSALPTLQSVVLKSCALRELPTDLLTGSYLLQNLSFAHNLLEVLPPTLLEGLTALRRLNLQGNKLAALPPTLLAPARHLQYIILSNNHLSELSKSVFSTERDQSNQLQELVSLELSFNRFNASTVQHLNFLIFGNMPSLKLDLRHNYIKTIIFPSESARPSAHVLLAGNPIACDCSLHDVLRYAAANGTLDITDTYCRSPKELYWQALSTLPHAQIACPLAAPACPRDCTCERRPGLAAGLLTLTCRAPPPTASWPEPARYQLRASALRLTAAPPTLELRLPPHCRRLGLAALNLTQLPPAPKLQLDQLDLSDNLLQELPDWLPVTGMHLLLSGNPLQCGCAAAGAVARLKSAAKLVDDWEALRCPDGARLSHVVVEPCVGLWRVLAGLGALGIGLALLAMALVLRYARELRGWAAVRGLDCCWPADPADADDSGKCYDAFVSYAHADERWVVGELAPRLERAGLRLCLHFRDWEAGGWIPAQIERSVRQARRTLLVVSEHFLASGWAQHEWRAALGQARPRLVLLLLGKLPALPEELRAHMARHTYVKVDDPWFWSKLRLALPRRPLRLAAPPDHHRLDVTQRLAFDDRLDQVSAPSEPVLELIHVGA